MKKFLILTAAAVAVFASCAKTIDNTRNTGQGDVLSFGVYVPQTKAGAAGQTTTASIQRTEANGGGFGVFAYYTDDADYSASAKPNFMYNQGVFYNASKWGYTPVKYWPNEYGSGANSTGTDKLSFFAYAPYVATASGSYGITAFAPANNAAGDPTITYVIDPTPSTAVDLCWAVDATDGLPWINKTKQSTSVPSRSCSSTHLPASTSTSAASSMQSALLTAKSVLTTSIPTPRSPLRRLRSRVLSHPPVLLI